MWFLALTADKSGILDPCLAGSLLIEHTENNARSFFASSRASEDKSRLAQACAFYLMVSYVFTLMRHAFRSNE